jgi:hypothetical protein
MVVAFALLTIVWFSGRIAQGTELDATQRAPDGRSQSGGQNVLFDDPPLIAPARPLHPDPTHVARALAAKGAPAASATSSTAPVGEWSIRTSDGTVRGVLQRWTHISGWQLVWDLPVDFSVDASATLHGSFEDALHTLVISLDKSYTPVQAILYRGNHVLRIVPQGVN